MMINTVPGIGMCHSMLFFIQNVRASDIQSISQDDILNHVQMQILCYFILAAMFCLDSTPKMLFPDQCVKPNISWVLHSNSTSWKWLNTVRHFWEFFFIRSFFLSLWCMCRSSSWDCSGLKRRMPFIPFALKNDTGCELQFWAVTDLSTM